jgi:hypothetical protein
MSIYNRNSGFGICGAKNIYSSKVKLDNWVEDKFGVDLVQNPKPRDSHFTTCVREQYIPPSEQQPACGPLTTTLAKSVKFLSKAELKAKNKDGLSYALLFQHGLHGEDITPDVSFIRYSILFVSVSAH